MAKERMELLISALNAEPEELLKRMKVASDAVLINQCGRNDYREIALGEYTVKVYDYDARGIGLSRNAAMVRATADIVLFADDDIAYDAGYQEKVLQAFESHPEADVIFFNFRIEESRATFHIEKEEKVGKRNCGRYGATVAAARIASIRKAGIQFSLYFGGGAPYSAGEDSLFFMDCAKKGLKMVAVPVTLGEEVVRESTWFKGYTEKFFFDRGVLYAFLYGKLAWPLSIRFILKKKQKMCQEVAPQKALKLMKKGIREGRALKKGKV
ncbi:MAG: glycosyltransferase family 2 protein [Lachnospiraceae bacterium]|nr:glycosyltransferase family 2 protein [Lachnospiraceae bacterium]